MKYLFFFFFSSRRRHTRSLRDWSSDVCSSDLVGRQVLGQQRVQTRDPGHTLRQPATGQPPTGLILHLDIVMGLGPVITNEQHPASSTIGTPDARTRRRTTAR